MIVLDNINTFFPVDLATNLGHTDPSKSDCIQLTWLAIYSSLNRVKSDLTHPNWSIVNKHFIHKCIYFCTVIYYTLENVLSQATLPVKQLFSNKTEGVDHVKFVFLFFL